MSVPAIERLTEGAPRLRATSRTEHGERSPTQSAKRAEGRVEFLLPRESAETLGPSILNSLQQNKVVTFAGSPHDSPGVHPVDAFATRLGRLFDRPIVRTTIYVVGTGFLVVFFLLA